MAAVSKLRWMIEPDVPGCPVPLIDRAIAIGAREWCDLTRSSREELEMDSTPGVQSYELMLSSDSFDIARVISVAYGKTELSPIANGTLAAKLMALGGAPRNFWVEGNLLWFDLVPQSVTRVVVSLAVKPKIESPTIPDDTVEGEAALAIAARAKRELMMSKQPWGDPAMATWNNAEFNRLATNNINLIDRNVTSAPIRAISWS